MAIKKKFNLISFITKLIVALFVMSFIFVVRYFSDVTKTEKKQTQHVMQGKRSLESRMRFLIQEKKDIAEDKEQVDEWLDQTNAENAMLKKQCEQYSRKITSQEKKIQDLLTEIDKKKDLTDESFETLRAQVEKKNEDIKTLKEYLKEYYDDNVKLKAKLKSLRENSIGANIVEVQPVVVAAKTNKNKKEAKIIEANPEYEFVVIDAGTDNGLEKGSVVFVNRGTKLLGRIVIEESEQALAVGKPFAGTTIDVIKKGDRVIY